MELFDRLEQNVIQLRQNFFGQNLLMCAYCTFTKLLSIPMAVLQLKFILCISGITHKTVFLVVIHETDDQILSCYARYFIFPRFGEDAPTNTLILSPTLLLARNSSKLIQVLGIPETKEFHRVGARASLRTWLRLRLKNCARVRKIS